MGSARKARVPYFRTTASVDADVEISPDELHEDGWHHESECAGTDPRVAIPLTAGTVSYAEAVASLHRQAHPRQLADPAACREEPCRPMSLAQLASPMGRTS